MKNAITVSGPQDVCADMKCGSKQIARGQGFDYCVSCGGLMAYDEGEEQLSKEGKEVIANLAKATIEMVHECVRNGEVLTDEDKEMIAEIEKKFGFEPTVSPKGIHIGGVDYIPKEKGVGDGLRPNTLGIIEEVQGDRDHLLKMFEEMRPKTEEQEVEGQFSVTYSYETPLCMNLEIRTVEPLMHDFPFDVMELVQKHLENSGEADASECDCEPSEKDVLRLKVEMLTKDNIEMREDLKLIVEAGSISYLTREKWQQRFRLEEALEKAIMSGSPFNKDKND